MVAQGWLQLFITSFLFVNVSFLIHVMVLLGSRGHAIAIGETLPRAQCNVHPPCLSSILRVVLII
jgi:hypothetical protein